MRTAPYSEAAPRAVELKHSVPSPCEKWEVIPHARIQVVPLPKISFKQVIPVQDIMKNIPISGLRDSVRAYHGDHHRFR